MDLIEALDKLAGRDMVNLPRDDWNYITPIRIIVPAINPRHCFLELRHHVDTRTRSTSHYVTVPTNRVLIDGRQQVEWLALTKHFVEIYRPTNEPLGAMMTRHCIYTLDIPSLPLHLWAAEDAQPDTFIHTRGPIDWTEAIVSIPLNLHYKVLEMSAQDFIEQLTKCRNHFHKTFPTPHHRPPPNVFNPISLTDKPY